MPKPTPDCRATERKHPWPMVRLGDVCGTINGIWKGLRKPFVHVGIIRSSNMTKNCEFSLDKTIYIDVEEKKYKQRKLLAGDIIVERSGGGPGQPVGRAVYFDLEDGEYSVSNFTSILRVKDANALNGKFLQLYLTSQYFQGATENIQSNTTGLHNLDFDAYLNFDVPLPPLSEQKEIVARLERELAAVEKMKKGFEALAETAKAEFEAELKEVFAELKSGGAGIGTDGTNGTHGTVETRRLGEIGRVVTGTTPSKGNKSYYGGEWPFYKPADLNQGRNTIGSGDSLTDAGWQSARQLPANSVLVTCIGATLGKTGIIRREGSCNQQINAIVCDGKALPEYVYYSILSPQFQNMLWQASNSTTLPMVNKSTFEKFEIPFPALAVQREVVARLDAAKARAEKLEAKAREGVAVCETMRKAILKEAFE